MQSISTHSKEETHIQDGVFKAPAPSMCWQLYWPEIPCVFQNSDASYDFSSNDPYPYPRYTDDWFNR